MCLGAALKERDLECTIPDPILLADELVAAALAEQAIPFWDARGTRHELPTGDGAGEPALLLRLSELSAAG
jgi:hypothetical protein